MIASPKLPIRIETAPDGFAIRRTHAMFGIAAIGAGLLLVAAGLTPDVGITSIAHAQNAPQWFGFADVVDKIKPAVISVRTMPDPGTRTGKATPPPDEIRWSASFAASASPTTTLGRRRAACSPGKGRASSSHRTAMP